MYYVYLTASQKHGTLYLGVTNNLVRRIYEHKTKAIPGFTSQYNVDRLVWYEIYDDPTTAITREKEIKKWRRDWKIRLIEERTRGGWICIPPSPNRLRRMDSGLAASRRPGMTITPPP